MTGRPTSVLERDCTAPLPLPVDEELIFRGESVASSTHTASKSRRYSSSQESHHADNTVSTPSSTHSTKATTSPTEAYSPASQQSANERSGAGSPNHATYFFHHTKLSLLTNEVLNRLYRAGVISESWVAIQTIISTLESKLEQWRSELPPLFDFTKKQRDQQFLRQRMSLGFFYYSTLTIINRPCLCRMDKKIPNESGKAKDFNRSTAVSCVHAAKDMLEMLPDEPNPIGLYKVCPWWCLVHHLMQAVTILMLELSFRSEHLPYEAEEILESAKKAVHWLESMSQENMAAHRAWRLCDDMLRRVAPKVGRTVTDIPTRNTSMYHPSNAMASLFSTTALPQDGTGMPNSSTHFPDQRYYAGMEPETSSFQPPIYTSYDDFSSYGQAVTSVPSPRMTPAFPISNEMDTMICEEAEDQRFIT